MKKIKDNKENLQLPEAFHLKRVRGQEIIALRRTKSVTIPFAQITRLCDAENEVTQVAHELTAKVQALAKLDVRVYYVALVQMENGCRISEVLRIASGDILSNGNFVVRGLKRSHDRICSCGEARDYLLQCRQNSFAPFQELDRFYIARCYDKCGIYMIIQDAKKRVTTHSLRHLYVKSAKNILPTEDIQKSLGHKSLNSTKHYEKTKERSS